MFTEVEILVQGIHEVILMFPEEKYYEVLSIVEIRPKRENSGAGIDRLVIFFYGKTYKSGKYSFMREQ